MAKSPSFRPFIHRVIHPCPLCLSIYRPVPYVGVYRGSESCRRLVRLHGREAGPLQCLFLPRTTQKPTQTYISMLQSRFLSCRRLRALDHAVTEGDLKDYLNRDILYSMRSMWIAASIAWMQCDLCFFLNAVLILVSFQRIWSISRFRMIYEVLWRVHFRDETWTNNRALSHSPILSVSVLAS